MECSLKSPQIPKETSYPIQSGPRVGLVMMLLCYFVLELVLRKAQLEWCMR